MVQAVEGLRSLAEPEFGRLQQGLELAIRHKGWTLRHASRLLQRYPEYVGRTITGRAELKVFDVFRLLEHLELEPFEFFQAYFPLGGASVAAAKRLIDTSGSPERMMMDRLAREGLARESAGIDARGWTARVSQLLREKIKRSGRSQPVLAESLGLTPSALGQRLRGNSRLLWWQVFAVLRAIEVDPGRFFYELVFPDRSLAATLTLGTVLDAWEQAQRELAEAALERAQRASPESAGASLAPKEW